MRNIESDLLGEEKPNKKVKPEVKPEVKPLPKIGSLVFFRKADDGEVVEHLAIVMAMSDTALDLNIFRQGYMDYVKGAKFDKEKTPNTWGHIDN